MNGSIPRKKAPADLCSPLDRYFLVTNEITSNGYAYEGPLGEVSHNGLSYVAWKDGSMIEETKTLQEALTVLVQIERLRNKAADDLLSLLDFLSTPKPDNPHASGLVPAKNFN